MRKLDAIKEALEAKAAPPRRPGETHPPVLQVLPRLHSGGVEQGTVQIARALSADGWPSLVASEGGRMVGDVLRAGARHVTLPLASKSPLTILANARRLARLVRHEGIGLLHARSRAPAWSAYLAARRTGRPFVTTFHGTYGIPEGRLGEWKKRYNAIMTRGDLVIANSRFTAEHMETVYGVAPERIRVIQRGIDVSAFDPTDVSDERIIQLSRRWRLPDGMPLILLPGRLTRWKGQMLLLEALARLGEREVCCALVGSDLGRESFRQELEERIAALGLGNKVFIDTDCKDIPAAYRLADVVVSASTDPEAFGRVVAEAQAMGRVLVAAGHGGAVEQVVDGQTGFLFRPGDSESLAVRLEQAIDLDLEARRSLATLAMERVRRHFSEARMCEETLAVYAELLERRNRNAASLA